MFGCIRNAMENVQNVQNVEFDKVVDVRDSGKRWLKRGRAARFARSVCQKRNVSITVLFDGIAYGVLLFLISVGLSVTLGLKNFVNLAHGAFAMLGGDACVVLLDRFGVRFLATLPIGAAVSALVDVLLERTLYRRLYGV